MLTEPSDELLNFLFRERTERGGAHTSYQERPLDWIEEMLEVPRHTIEWSLNDAYQDHEWDGTPDPLTEILDSLVRGEDVGVEAGTGTGKTFLCACITLWFLACFEDSIVVTVAPKKEQLLLHLWKEIDRLWPKFQRHFPNAEKLSTGKIRMRPGDETWAATAFVAGVGAGEEVATKAAGWHAEHMLIICEETPGIRSAIMKALENTRTGPHNLQLAVGNPDHREDALHRWCKQPNVNHVRISALDFPNVVCEDPDLVPGAVSEVAVLRRKILYRNTPALYESRVRGISPKQAFGVALRFNEKEHLETLAERDLLHGIQNQGWTLWGSVDTGDWRTAFVVGAVDRSERLHIVREEFWHRVDSSEIAAGIHRHLDDLDAPRGTTIVCDQRSAHTVTELNKALAALPSPYRVAAVSPENKKREASVRRLNDLLGDRRLLFRRNLGVGLE